MATITIKLKESLSANGFREGERVHHKALDKVQLLIKEQLEAARNYHPLDRNADGIKRCYNAISIFGERGVGKTSFLMSLRQILTTSQDESYKKLCLLPFIDPTLIEEKGHIFLLIISQIDEVVCNVLHNPEADNEMEDYANKWDEAKEKLAAGLPSLKPEGMTYHEPQWNEDKYVMNNGMKSVKAAFSLEANFHKLVSLALKILKKESFVLMFDDIDVDFQRGWDLLETVRKFLTTPQVIIIISGNLKLFSKNVRKQQWRNLGKELLKNEVDARDTSAVMEYTQLVNELEGQYLLKILNSENRIYLYDVGKNIVMNGDIYKVVDDAGEPKDLELSYREVLRYYGVQNPSIAQIFIDFLETTSLRTQVHFLYNFRRMKEEDDLQNMLSAISAFSSRIYAQGVNIDMAVNESSYTGVLLHYLLKEHLLEDAYQLVPSFDSTDMNSVVSGFAFLFSMLVRRHPNLIFDYWVKVCMVRNAMRFLTYDSYGVGNANGRNSVDRYCQVIGAFQRRNLRSIVGNGLAYVASLNDKQVLDGTVRLLGFGGLAKKRRMGNRIDCALYDKQEQKLIGYLPLVCLLHSSKNQRELYFSFNALLANIGQVTMAAGSGNASQTLLAACQPVSYQIKSDVSSGTISDDDANQEMELVLVDDYGIGRLVESWAKKYDDIGYAPDMFGRIATRFFYAQSTILENNKNVKLGELFSLLTMAFYNACLVEEIKTRDDIVIKGFNINNVSSSSYILVNNLAKLMEIADWQCKIPFSKWMMSCPLLLPFLDMEAGHNFQKFFGDCWGNEDDLMAYWSKTSMTKILDGVTINRMHALVPFYYAKDKILQTIDRINGANLDLTLIFDDESISEAQIQLQSIFKSVSFDQIRKLRSKCKISEKTGNLVLK